LSDTEGKIKDLKKNLKKINKNFDSMVLTTGGDHHLVVDKLPFEIPSLDSMLGGGLPIGRITLVYGDFSSGKTFLSLKAIAAAQAKGMSVILIDSDRSYEPKWAKLVGVDVSNLIVARPNYGEQALDLAEALISSGEDLVIMDTMDALLPISDAESDMEDNFIGLQSRMISRGLRKILRVNQKTIFFAISHVREGFGRFASKRIPGGKAQEEMASLMLLISKGAAIKDEENDPKKRVGFNMRVTIEKDKIHGNMYDSCELPFRFKDGAIDTMSGLFQLGLDVGVIKKSGGWYDFMDKHVMGKLGVIELLRGNEDLQLELRNQIEKEKE